MKLKDVRVRVLKHHTQACKRTLAIQDGWATAWWIPGEITFRSRSGRVGRKFNKDIWLKARCNLRCGAEAVINAMDLGDLLATNGKLPKSAADRPQEKPEP